MLVLYALAHVAWVPSQVLILALNAAGRHGTVGLAMLADATLNVIVSVVLVVVLGPIGVAVSTLVLLVAAHAVVIPLIAARRLAIPLMSLARSLGVGAATGVAVVTIVALVPADGLGGLLVRGAIGIGAVVAVLAFDQRASGRRTLVAPQP